MSLQINDKCIYVAPFKAELQSCKQNNNESKYNLNNNILQEYNKN